MKSDTDGHDFAILKSAIDWIASEKPALLYEYQIQNEADGASAIDLANLLSASGYNSFILWNDEGNFFLSSREVEQLTQITSYIAKTTKTSRSFGDLDVAFFHQNDADIFEAVVAWYQNNE